MASEETHGSLKAKHSWAPNHVLRTVLALGLFRVVLSLLVCVIICLDDH